ncbi:class I SAM-dependent methyltransferase [Pseudoxanthomonas sangjuensis]|uniref:class I SAM-dependent methyltransferase n=1 Tax=Pseudoxanthomonas sangjuensis TaxID=1503750 RepID=UPI001390D134|nr:class I SAM-dependent methyltransferase [Pseudoxanthomonas sangjuensis]KAF1715732.1 methyltransferase [Pseudoxanthomonas sangjuensis]
MNRTLFAAILPVLLLGACAAAQEPSAPADDASAAADAAKAGADAWDAVLAGAWREAGNVARDRYRHPRETLTFFGVTPQQTVVEITPGGGWYAEILAPYLRDGGHYVAAVTKADSLQAKFGADAGQYGKAEIVVFDPKAPVFGPAGSADVVLTFRNAHNWVDAGTEKAYFKGFFDVLKPGGTLGVVDHRAKPGTDIDTMKKSGYLTEELVIELATGAGFELAEKSEVNANPADTADHPNGVWTLPPTNNHDAADDAKYKAIGESDRMTLKFVKPAE